MVMTRPSAFHPSLPLNTNPPPPASLNPDIKSQLVSIVSCLEKLLPFLSAEISKSTVHYNGDQSVNHKDEKSTEKIHGEHNLVHLEEAAGDVKPKAMELGAEAVGTDSSEMTKPRSMEVEAKFDQKEIPKTTKIPKVQPSVIQPPIIGFSTSLKPQNQKPRNQTSIFTLRHLKEELERSTTGQGMGEPWKSYMGAVT